MNRHIIKFLAKISTISVLLIVFFNAGLAFFGENTNTIVTKKENKYNYKKTSDIILGTTGVAITTNLGTRYKERVSMPATIYKEVMSIGEIMSNKHSADTDIVTKNMLQIKEYLNVMKTDVKSLINNSYNKAATLDAFISQIEYRYKSASISISNLDKQRITLEEALKSNEEKLNNLKTKLNNDFAAVNTEKTLENIDEYLSLQKEYNYSRIYIVFINQFIKQYSYLNSYNKTLLDTLINNKEAIIKDAYIVIPDSGSDLLKQFNLIYSEEEIKNK